MWMIKIMPQRVKLIKSRFKGGKFIWKIFWMGILLTLSVWGRGGSSSVCSGGCLPWETHLCPCVAWPCGEEVNSVKHWNSDNANLIGADNSCDKGSPPQERSWQILSLWQLCVNRIQVNQQDYVNEVHKFALIFLCILAGQVQNVPLKTISWMRFKGLHL